MSTINNSPFEVRQSEKFGRYLVAKKDLPAGELIFKEAPLVLYSRFSETFKSDTTFTCISCHNVMEKENAVHCKQCGWSFCSLICSFDETHRELECPVLKENKIAESKKAIHFHYLLRVLQLKEKGTPKWNVILNLASSLAMQDEKYNVFLRLKSSLAQKFLKEICNMTVEVSLIQQLIKIMKINEFTCTQYREGETPIKKYCLGLYATSSMISHSCSPNMEWFCAPEEADERGTAVIYSLQAIPAGTMATISYTEKYNFATTRFRRPNLMRDLGFWCQCGRCSDATELGTFFSAIKCTSCEDGWLLPNPLVEHEDYKCQKCDYSLEVAEADKMENAFKDQLVESSGDSTNSTKLNNLDALILDATTKYGLHPSHSLVIEAIEEWLSLQDLDVLFATSPRSKAIYQTIVHRAERSLNIFNLFGNLDQRTSAESEIGMAVARYYFKTHDYLVICDDIPNLTEKIEILQKIVGHFQRGVHPADPRTFNADTRDFISVTKNRYAMWKFRLTDCVSHSMKEKVSL